MRPALFAALAFAFTPAHAASTCAPPGPQAACEQISKIVDTFRTSLVKKDRASFLALFYSPSIPWIGVTTDHSLNMIIARKKDASKPDPAKLYASASPAAFIDGLIKGGEPAEETFENVRIDTDGDIAQVYFDYGFHFGSYRANSGKESWQLVRAPDGWKITSVIWTMEFNPEPRPHP